MKPHSPSGKGVVATLRPAVERDDDGVVRKPGTADGLEIAFAPDITHAEFLGAALVDRPGASKSIQARRPSS